LVGCDEDMVGRSSSSSSELRNGWGATCPWGSRGTSPRRRVTSRGSSISASGRSATRRSPCSRHGASERCGPLRRSVEPRREGRSGAGLQLTGRFFDDESYAFSVGYNFGALGFFGSPQFNADETRTHTVWQARLGYPQRNIVTEYFTKDKSYLAMDLKGEVTYRKFRLFDEERHSFATVLADLEHAKNDPKVKGSPSTSRAPPCRGERHGRYARSSLISRRRESTSSFSWITSR